MAALLHAAALLAFFMALRVEELVASSKKELSRFALVFTDLIRNDQKKKGKAVCLVRDVEKELCQM